MQHMTSRRVAVSLVDQSDGLVAADGLRLDLTIAAAVAELDEVPVLGTRMLERPNE